MTAPPQPAVVIVGRPNVGKSTLFNRLTGRRDALVSDIPGLTRDRREGVADFGQMRVRLFDTAGLEEAAPDSISARMRRQTEAAIEAADLTLFVIDSRAGVTPADEAWARMVRSSGRPVVLVANKAEGRAGDAGFYEAFKLGFGEPVAVSAEHGEGIGELISDMMAALGHGQSGGSDFDDGNDALAEGAARPLRVAVVGRPNAGKSTLVNALLEEERMITGPEPGLTRDSISTDFKWKEKPVRLFDTAGLRRKAKVSEKAERISNSDAVRTIRFAEVVVLLIDVERPFEHQDLTIAGLVAEEGRALVVAINKWDLVEDKQKRLRELRDVASSRIADLPGVPVEPISALSEKGLDNLMTAVFDIHQTWNARISTAKLNRWLEEATARHAPPASSGRRIKIRYMTQPSTRPPTFALFCSKPEGLPRSYVRYLSNALREAFRLPGVPIRLHLRKGENPYENRRRKSR